MTTATKRRKPKAETSNGEGNGDVGRPLAPPPPAKTYRQFLGTNLFDFAIAKYPVGADFRAALIKAGFDVKLETIYGWYKGRRFPDSERIRTVADVLGVTTDDLLPRCPRHLRKTIGQGQGRTS